MTRNEAESVLDYAEEDGVEATMVQDRDTPEDYSVEIDGECYWSVGEACDAIDAMADAMAEARGEPRPSMQDFLAKIDGDA